MIGRLFNCAVSTETELWDRLNGNLASDTQVQNRCVNKQMSWAYTTVGNHWCLWDGGWCGIESWGRRQLFMSTNVHAWIFPRVLLRGVCWW